MAAMVDKFHFNMHIKFCILFAALKRFVRILLESEKVHNLEVSFYTWRKRT